MTTFYCLRFETPQPGGAGPPVYIPQEQGDPVIPPGTGHVSQGYGGGIRIRLHLESYKQYFKFSSYLTANTLRLPYKDKPVNNI
jgi:hypothetical protein